MKSFRIIYFILILIIFSNVFHPCVWAKDFLVAIDTGHSRNQPGAISARGIGEYFFNKRIAEGVHARIMAQNNQIKSFLINNQDSNISLSERTKLASDRKADLLISIHHDSVQRELMSSWDVDGEKQYYCDKYKGFSMFYSEKNADPYDSLLFAIFLGSEMIKNKFTQTLHHAENMKGERKILADSERGIYKYDGLVVLKKATIPAILLECGIIVNRDEELELGKTEYQGKIITSITEAVKRYWEFKYNKAKCN